MADGILHLREAEMTAIINELAVVYTGISEVAGGTYVTGNVFTESRGECPGEITEILPVLSNSATKLSEIIESVVRSLEKVIAEFEYKDLELAVEALRSPWLEEWRDAGKLKD